MIGLSGQSWLALAMVIVAAIYLGRCAWRTLRGLNAGPGCCGGGCPSLGQDTSESQSRDAAASTGTFVPLENLADLARRHKQQSDP
jgi:hypothetical protein